MHMTIQPVISSVFPESDESFEHVNELVGFEVYAKDGTLIGSGETREEALQAAQEFILLPAKKLAKHV